MKRDAVKIDSEKCTGCGICVDACAEGAIKMVGGKAVLVDEACCDGLGACLPACPAGAITVESREAAPFSGTVPARNPPVGAVPMAHCPGSGARAITRTGGPGDGSLSQWPIQLRLVPANAPYLSGCDLLVAADCSAFACGGFHEKFIEGRVTLIGCPKLDPRESWEKLVQIVSGNDVKSITVVRMEVPCCSGIVSAAEKAVEDSGKDVPLRTFTIRVDGRIVE